MGRRCYAHFLQMMIQYRRTNIAEAIYSDLRHGGKHFPAALRHHNLMLGMYADMKDEDGQRAVLERMDASGVECNIFSFTSIVKCQGKLGKHDGVMDCFEEVLRRGVKIDYMFAIHVVSYIPPRMTPAVVARLKAAGMDLAERDAIGLASALITSCSLVNNDVLAEKLFFSCTHNLRTNMLCRRMLHCYCSTLNYSAAFTLISDHPKIIKAKEIGICMGLFVQAAQKHCEDETKLNDIIRMAETVSGVSKTDTAVRLHFGVSNALIQIAVTAKRTELAGKYAGIHRLSNLRFTPELVNALNSLGIKSPKLFETSETHYNQCGAVWSLNKPERKKPTKLHKPTPLTQMPGQRKEENSPPDGGEKKEKEKGE